MDEDNRFYFVIQNFKCKQFFTNISEGHGVELKQRDQAAAGSITLKTRFTISEVCCLILIHVFYSNIPRGFMSEKQKKKRNIISFKDLQIAYLRDGLDSVTQLYQEGKASRIALKKACASLKQMGTPMSSFEQWMQENVKVNVRGRSTPKTGSERTYRAQKIKTGGSFLRLPLASLEIEKGQVLSVSFEKNRIVIQKK